MNKSGHKRKPYKKFKQKIYSYFVHFERLNDTPSNQTMINRLNKLEEQNILIDYARVSAISFHGPYLLASKLPYRSIVHHIDKLFPTTSAKITQTSKRDILQGMNCYPIGLKRKRKFVKTVFNLDYVEGKGYVPSKEHEEKEQSDTTENKVENKGISIIEKEFEGIVGLNNIKKSMRKIYHLLEVQKKRKEEKLPANPVTLHSVFRGPPGTGKTTVAKILGTLYKELGVLKKGHLVAVERGDLVAGYIGHTEQKTKKQLEKAIGGILFIDEAYSLTRGDDDTKDYGKEVIETLVPFMENNKDKLAVIVAGYEDKMDKFIKSNEGLKSRFTQYYDFKSYTPDELTKIFRIQLSNEGYKIKQSTFDRHIKHFLTEYKKNQDPRTFGNAREVRNIIDELKMIQADRIQTTNVERNNLNVLENITHEDIIKLYDKYWIKIRPSKHPELSLYKKKSG